MCRCCFVWLHCPQSLAAFRCLRVAIAVAVASVCAGCAGYTPLPLAEQSGAEVARLSVPAAQMPTEALARHRFDPTDGLDVTEVAMLAVANNPALKVQRDDLGVARAQAFAAGLLPDPQLNTDVGFPTSSGAGLTRAFDLNLSEDVGGLLGRSARRSAARDHDVQVNLELLWAEWQTVARVRLLFAKVRSSAAHAALLQREARALAPIETEITRALDAGTLSYGGAAGGLDALASVRAQLATVTRGRIKVEHALHVALGLAPAAPLRLVGGCGCVTPTAARFRQALSALPERRPDLLALQAGYAAQEARVRAAIIARFPAIVLGFVRARDTSNIDTRGFSVGITLPLFNRNRGNIAIARATRERLHDVYAERLLATRSDMDRLEQDLASLHTQMVALAAHVQRLDATRASAARAWQAGLLDWPTYLAIRSSALTADLRRLDLRAQYADEVVALETLLGGDWNAAGGAKVMTHLPFSIVEPPS